MNNSPKETMVVENDLVLVRIDEQPVFYARVESFTPDHKPKWWQVKLLVLQYPAKHVTWILRREQINGESFTMSDTPIRIEKVVPSVENSTEEQQNTQRDASPTLKANTEQEASSQKKPARILNLGSRREDT